MRETRHQAEPDGIIQTHEDDRGAASDLLKCTDRCCAAGYGDINLGTAELCGKARKVLWPIPEPVLYD
jgi:hypothetical protein